MHAFRKVWVVTHAQSFELLIDTEGGWIVAFTIGATGDEVCSACQHKDHCPTQP